MRKTPSLALAALLASWTPAEGRTTTTIGSIAASGVTYPLPPRPVGADRRPSPLGDAGISPRPAPALAATVGTAIDGLHGVLGDRYTGFPRRLLFARLGMTHPVAETDRLPRR